MFEQFGSPSVLNAVLQWSHHGQMSGHWGNGMMGSGVGVVWLGLLFVLVVGTAVALVVLAARMASPSTERASTDDALAALRERYARGEIDDEEFETRRTKLERS